MDSEEMADVGLALESAASAITNAIYNHNWDYALQRWNEANNLMDDLWEALHAARDGDDGEE